MQYKLSQNQQQRFSQKMALTPQMRQSIQLLGMSVTDLAEYVDYAVSQNPCLKKIIEDSIKRSYQNRSPIAVSPETFIDYADMAKDKVDPRLALTSHVRMLGLDDKELEIAEYLIYSMDENGYIGEGAEEAADNLGVSADDVEKVVQVIQTMEPAGIGARDIRECLQIQLRRAGKEGSLEYRIVDSHLSEVAQNNIDAIAKALKSDKEKVSKALDSIKRLNPRPASTLLGKETDAVIPELIANLSDKKVLIQFNSNSLPRLKVYNPYDNNLDIIKDPDARRFLKENMDAAKALIDNLKRREDTLCRVAHYILNYQYDALKNDSHDIRCLTIRDVAQALDFNPSTVSRAVSNKYVQVGDKVIPLKGMLSHGIRKENGEIASKAAVKNRIAAILKNEEPSSPLSDSDIEDMLKLEGILVKRRTIAKYRECLRILPSHLRRKRV